MDYKYIKYKKKYLQLKKKYNNFKGGGKKKSNKKSNKKSKIITLVSGNPGKIKEFKEILGLELKTIDIDLPEIQSTDVKEVAREKLKTAMRELKNKPCIIDDSGLHINSLNGFPGALIKFFHKKLKNDGIVNIAGGSQAQAVSVIGYFDGKNEFLFEGKTEGKIPDTPKGNGFGWDPIFVPNGSELSYAEMSSEEKNKISQRRLAIEQLKKHLENEK
jgi:non-canonical purine NTP pyrophosphatase (RdgB/HAM1 family)